MCDFNKEFKKFGIAIPNIYLPASNVDMQKWAIIACDQFTSEKEYWKDASNLVGNDPSTLNLIFPECYLEDGDEEKRIKEIAENMENYVKQNIIEDKGCFFVLVRRETPTTQPRWGLIAAIDLEQYDFSKGSTSLVRATEGTIIERIPPRVRIRKDASLEFPHIMILLNDSEKGIVEPLIDKANSESLEKIYDFDLMFGSGNIKGFKISEEDDLMQVLNGLAAAGDIEKFSTLYGSKDLLMYAVGDGNHSLATAKTIWEQKKQDNPKIDKNNDPARWALVELNNIYDEGIVFEPIHRVLFGINKEKFVEELKKEFQIIYTKNISDKALNELAESIPETQQLALLSGKTSDMITILDPSHNLTAGTIQDFIDKLLKENKEITIDYIHGIESTKKLAEDTNNLGIILPNISKANFFETVIKDGAFPRKTFSMGEAKEKRFYIEGRKIK
ncbi:MAG: DUF1015 domain-containing protein [Spirochaetales bacterium]|nr:DUF1015 domain-containing protein [Spirochaetales bacterium]